MASLKLVHALALAAKACHLGNCWVQPLQALAMKKLMVQRLKALFIARCLQGLSHDQAHRSQKWIQA